MKKPDISVIIPAFRAESFITRAVTSVLAQTVGGWELLIASDDGQDYIDVLGRQGISDARIHCIPTGATGTGPARARNCALEVARAGIIASLDADDALLPFHLEQLSHFVAQHAIAISQVDYLDHESGFPILNKAKVFPSGLLELDEVLLACLHSYAPVVFDRARIPHRWNEHIPLLEDAVFLAEAFNYTPKVWYESRPSYRYFRRSDSLCNAEEAVRRFLEAGRTITELLETGSIGAFNPKVRTVLNAYIARNNDLEAAFERAHVSGKASDYQQFIGDNLAMLHAPLI